MSQSKSSGSQNKQSANPRAQDVAKQRAGKPETSSHKQMSRQEAGAGKGASKQESGH